MSKNNDVDYLLSPVAIRERAAEIFESCKTGGTAFAYHPEKLKSAVDYVLEVIRKNYPSLDIPFHSRWGHFKAGGIDRVKALDARLAHLDPLEKARTKLDLVITSVLLDAGAGPEWKFFEQETQQTIARSEGLGVASLKMFMAGAMSADGKSPRADGLHLVTANQLRMHFQVNAGNPLIGVEGRVLLLNNLSGTLDGRPGNILDLLIKRHGQTIPATGILRAVLDGFGSIWPGRLSIEGRNLGDVWRHSNGQLVPFHKLSQWMTYSLMEPIQESGHNITGVEELTGLAEYRNGGFILDSGLVSLRHPDQAEKSWTPESDLIIEWRALTVALLDIVGEEVQKALGKTPQEFPLAKVLEGGTWWAGRFLAKQKRKDGGPPLNIQSDGTVF